MRSAVSLAEGFWYQHSFISFTRAERVCGEQRDRKLKRGRGGRHNSGINVAARTL